MKKTIIVASVIIAIIAVSTLILLLNGNLRSTADLAEKGDFDPTKYIQIPVLVNSDTIFENIVDQIAHVQSRINFFPPEYERNNRTIIDFSLPDSTVSWSFYIGVNQAGIQAYDRASRMLGGAVGPAAYYSPTAALALGLTSYLSSVQSDENVRYWLVDDLNKELFLNNMTFNYLKSGDVVNDFSRMISPLTGKYYLCLINDNYFQDIVVIVKITAACVHNTYKMKRVRNKARIP